MKQMERAFADGSKFFYRGPGELKMGIRLKYARKPIYFEYGNLNLSDDEKVQLLTMDGKIIFSVDNKEVSEIICER